MSANDQVLDHDDKRLVGLKQLESAAALAKKGLVRKNAFHRNVSCTMTIARKLTDQGQRRVLLKDLMSACAETYEAGDKRRNPTSGLKRVWLFIDEIAHEDSDDDDDDDADDVDIGYRAKIAAAAAQASSAVAKPTPTPTPTPTVAGNGNGNGNWVVAARVTAGGGAARPAAGNDDGPSTKKARLTALYNGPAGSTGAGAVHR